MYYTLSEVFFFIYIVYVCSCVVLIYFSVLYVSFFLIFVICFICVCIVCYYLNNCIYFAFVFNKYCFIVCHIVVIIILKLFNVFNSLLLVF